MTDARTERVSPQKLAANGDRKPLSRVLCGAAALVGLGLAVDGAAFQQILAPSFDAVFATAASPNPELEPGLALLSTAQRLAQVLLPCLGAAFFAVIAAGALQVGSVRLPSARGERRSPFDFAARIDGLFSGERLLDGAIVAAMLGVLCVVAWLTVAPNVHGLLALSGSEPRAAARAVLTLLGTLAFRLIAAGLVLGALDYLQRRVRHALSLQMTPRELREEQREQYGDPAVRAERSRRQRAGARPGARA